MSTDSTSSNTSATAVEVRTDSIHTTFFVRRKLDEDRVVQLALLMENGADVAPIRITDDHQLIDGRHRLEAAKLAGWATIKACVEPARDKGELIADAFASNCGGSVPPTRADILFTIQQLLQQGWGHGKVVKALPFPKEVARRYINDCMSKINQARVNQAIIDVRDRGFTMAQAAANRDVDIETLKSKMTKDSRRIAGAEEYKGNLTTRFRSLSRANASLFSKLMDAYEEGEITIDYVREVLEHTRSLHAQSTRSFEGWNARFAAVLANERTVARGGK